MNAPLSPIVSEFETEDQAAGYDRWFRAKVQAGRDSARPGTAHDEAMALIRQKLHRKLDEQDEASAGKPGRDR
ncbi:MAG: stability determinant [Burkholderiaceae bacterium]